MRHLRQKAIRKYLRQFHFLCGIKPPYKVLLDGNFIAMCLEMKVDLHERVPKFLQVKASECQFYISHASIRELEILGEPMKPALELARTLQVVKSQPTEDDADQPQVHQDMQDPDQAVDVRKAIEAIIGERNQRKFIVATQEVELRQTLRLVPGVPLIYLNRSVLVFEPISKATLAIVRQEDQAKMARLDVNEKRKLDSVTQDDEPSHALTGLVPPRKKHKAKGPNPLSCKKSTKKKVRSKKRKPNAAAANE